MDTYRKHLVSGCLFQSRWSVKKRLWGILLAGILAGCASKTPVPTPTAVAPAPHVQAIQSPKDRLAVMGVKLTPERMVQFAAQGDTTVVDLLLQAGMSGDTTEPVRQVSALHNAATQGHLKIMNMLIEHGADVNAADWHGNTPLINAAYFGHLEAIKVLLGKGANINAVSKEGITALSAAIYSGNDLVANYLLAQGADSSLPKEGGLPALTVAQRAKRDAVATSIQNRAITK